MKIVAALAMFALLAGLPAAGGADEMQDAAEAAARQWLALVDAGDYQQSYAEASSLFRGATSESDWITAVSRAREPLGAMNGRTLTSATFMKSMPGAPDGEYVVIQFATTFERKVAAVETVTPMKDDDGQWRVSGYYIK